MYLPFLQPPLAMLCLVGHASVILYYGPWVIIFLFTVWINIVLLPLLHAFVLYCHVCCIALCFITLIVAYFSHLCACLTCLSVVSTYVNSSYTIACRQLPVLCEWLLCIWLMFFFLLWINIHDYLYKMLPY